MPDLRQYLLTIIAAAILCALINRFIGEKSAVSGIIKLISGIFLSLYIISPFIKIEKWDFESFTHDIQQRAEDAVSTGTEMADESLSHIIKTKTESYILDKAASLDLSIEVEVTLDDSNPPRPYKVYVYGDASPYAKEILRKYILDTFGIAREDQHWR